MHTCADHHDTVSLQRCSSVAYPTAAAYQDPVPLPFGLNESPLRVDLGPSTQPSETRTGIAPMRSRWPAMS